MPLTLGSQLKNHTLLSISFYRLKWNVQKLNSDLFHLYRMIIGWYYRGINGVLIQVRILLSVLDIRIILHLSAVSNTQKSTRNVIHRQVGPSPSGINDKKDFEKKVNYIWRGGTCWINGVRCLTVIYKFYSGLPGLIVLIRRENKSNYSRAWSAEEAKT